MTGPVTGYRDAHVHRGKRNYKTRKVKRGIVVQVCGFARRWRGDTRGLGNTGARTVGGGRSRSRGAWRVLRGDRPRFYPALGRGTRLQGNFVILIRPVLFIYSFYSPSYLCSTLNATGSFAYVTFKSATVTFAQLLRGLVSFVETRERLRERNSSGEGDRKVF